MLWLLIGCGGNNERPIAQMRASPPPSATSSQPTPTSTSRPTPSPTPDRSPTPTTLPSATPTAFPTSAVPNELATTIDVGGYRLFLRCNGVGSPTVVLDSGLGDSSTSWDPIRAELVQTTRTCVYDRAGRGLSERAPTPRTSQDIVGDLHTLLDRAGETGPFVLVGHSFGGLNMRLYASQYRLEVAGLVLVDALPASLVHRLPDLFTPQELAQARGLLRFNAEGIDLEASMQQATAAGSLGDLPLVVLTSERPTHNLPGLPADRALALWTLQHDLQADLVRLSTSGTQLLAEESGHYIHADQPALVLDAIAQVADARR